MTNPPPRPAVCAQCGAPAEFVLVSPTDATPADSIGAGFCANCTTSTSAGFEPIYNGPPLDVAQKATPAAPSLLDEVISFFRRFVVFADEVHYDIAALWVLHTHTFDSAAATPYIYVNSAEPQCGKTRTMEVSELLTHTSKRTSSASPGMLYAVIEKYTPTLYIDEVDAVFYGAANEDLRAMLNSGYKRGGSVERQVMRKGGERDIESYSTFCPKMLAGIDNGEIPPTIADRCISFNLKRKLRSETVERLNHRIVGPEAEALRLKIALWAAEHLETLGDAFVKDIPEISDRAFEIAEPLVQIGMQFRGWTERSRRAIIHVLGEKPKTETLATKALRIAFGLFEEGNRDRISSAEFAAAMEIPSVPRASRILTPYGITTTTIKFTGGGVSKGYRRESFTDAWERYTPELVDMRALKGETDAEHISREHGTEDSTLD